MHRKATIEMYLVIYMYAQYLHTRNYCNDIIFNLNLKIIVFLGIGS